MSDLPEKVLRYDIIKVDRQRKKLCQCHLLHTPHYVIDSQNRVVECADCGAIIDPFEAMFRLALSHERQNAHWEAVLEQRRQIANYKPHLVVIKELERKYRSHKFSMLPSCPNCGENFELEEILYTHWTNRAFVQKRKELKQEEKDG